jgi:hypothetical protein
MCRCPGSCFISSCRSWRGTTGQPGMKPRTNSPSCRGRPCPWRSGERRHRQGQYMSHKPTAECRSQPAQQEVTATIFRGHQAVGSPGTCRVSWRKQSVLSSARWDSTLWATEDAQRILQPGPEAGSCEGGCGTTSEAAGGKGLSPPMAADSKGAAQ